ncbi:MAG: hypothetical protein DRH50_16230 [Deltaproteobacteria bacterium]|nr:MAG: hypothetical protein DRH50_16230 [Deltaproteobacteria bacterium]
MPWISSGCSGRRKKPGGRTVIGVVGPEGGFASKEIHLAGKAGFVPVLTIIRLSLFFPVPICTAQVDRSHHFLPLFQHLPNGSPLAATIP